MSREETWNPVLGFEGLYEVSSLGNVRSLDRDFALSSGTRYRRKGKILSFNVKKGLHPYRRVVMSKNGEASLCLVSRLVLSAFDRPPLPGEQACHNNSNPSDNRIENLRWDTPVGNYLDRAANGTHPLGEKNNKARIREVDVKFIRESNLPCKALGLHFGLSPKYVSNIKQNISWKHLK